MKSVREYKKIAFLEINDGSHYKNLQVVTNPAVLSSLDRYVVLGSGMEIFDALESIDE